MAERKGFQVKMNPFLPEEGKFKRLAKLIGPAVEALPDPEELLAMGILASLWCFTMRSHDGGTIRGMSFSEIADEIGWYGDPKLLENALLTCGQMEDDPEALGFINKIKRGVEIHDWPYWQDDPKGQRERSRDRQRAHRARAKGKEVALAPTEPGVPTSAADEQVRLLMKKALKRKLRNNPDWIRRWLDAWVARGKSKQLDVILSSEDINGWSTVEIDKFHFPINDPSADKKPTEIIAEFKDRMKEGTK